jgi:uncharacterized protein YaeQ
MNDIGSEIKECEFYLFADDTLKLSVLGTSVEDNREKWNRDLKKNLSKWLKFNNLKLNENKNR